MNMVSLGALTSNRTIASHNASRQNQLQGKRNHLCGLSG